MTKRTRSATPGQFAKEKTEAPMNKLDQLITTFDLGLRTVFASPHAGRSYPGSGPEAELSDAERAHAAALMRVNHVGEVCAQALYAGQALTAKNEQVRAELEQAARGNRSPRLVRDAHQRARWPQKPAQPAVVRRRVRHRRGGRAAGGQMESRFPGRNRTSGRSASRRAPAATARSRRKKPRGGRTDEGG